ncbi:molybdopterin molybdotransferase MoeA [Cytophaga hutchinsonii]|uniref:Molybdopterin molybdenumtransferase n=1 Tax=Cytophaga hutchinsonii (strain ATCC 33406 / DSM 1761 / CIP 103989 / NBRC 15051 / NCIMB 9469 / D465) TaxID=269798 RepID=A0A6N4SQG3_CYTH3|nr:molybdopterin molybdotransferase MoeA [Cytophaga hutchinsonii]ABG58601.1 molybdopterin molybdochelatase [Cytophaga hutchinsonii ATCC 33406]SFX77970.1 molybdopterin molybdochelatase [Cytophaga hutchinsonii ATCC 33406]
MISFDDAQKTVLSKKLETTPTQIPLLESIGNFYSADISADRNYPPFNRAAVDGIAFYWDGISPVKESYQIAGSIFAGEMWQKDIQAFECVWIMTGAPVPKQLNMLVRVEDISAQNNHIYFRKGLTFTRMQNIAKEGEDILKDTVVLTKGMRITPQHVSTLASLGYGFVPSYGFLTATILRTGNEITEPSTDVLAAWQIRDSNSFTIRSLLKDYPVTINMRSAQDTMEALVTQIEAGKHSNILILTGGVSAGAADLVPEALLACGFTCHFHKVEIRPGKPIWFGTHPTGCIAFGLPGNPFSVQIGVKVFVEPFIRACFNNRDKTFIHKILTHERLKKISFDEFIVADENIHGVCVKKHNGSGDISASLSSTGMIRHQAQKEKLEAGDTVDYYPWMINW